VEDNKDYFYPKTESGKTMLSGTGWYTHCGPVVGGCDLQGTNETFAAELKELGFTHVWNNNFAEYYMGNFIPPINDTSQEYVSDDNYTISVDYLNARFTEFSNRGVYNFPYVAG